MEACLIGRFLDAPLICNEHHTRRVRPVAPIGGRLAADGPANGRFPAIPGEDGTGTRAGYSGTVAGIPTDADPRWPGSGTRSGYPDRRDRRRATEPIGGTDPTPRTPARAVQDPKSRQGTVREPSADRAVDARSVVVGWYPEYTA